MRGRKSIIALLATAAVLGCLAVGVSVVWQFHKAGRALNAEKQRAGREGNIEIRSRGFALAPNPDARLLAGPPEIRDICRFNNSLYAASSSGLLVFAEDGRLLEHWTTAEGLPSLDLTAVAVLEGALWVGTKDAGLLRLYDDSWTQFLPDARPFRKVNALLATPQGALFVGTDDGLLRYSNRKFERFAAPVSAGTAVTRIAGDSATFYAGTFRNGLLVYQNGSMRRYDRQDGLLDPYVTDISVGPAGVFVATPQGIQQFRQEHFADIARNVFAVSIDVAPSFLIGGAGVPAREVATEGRPTEPGTLWAGTIDRGIIPLKLSEGARKAALRPGGAMTVDGPVTLRRLENQLLAFAGGRSFALTPKNAWQEWGKGGEYLSDANISALLLRPSGELWIGYFDHGIDIYSGDRRTRHMQDSTLFCINYLSQDSRGNVYASTANGLAIIRPDGAVDKLREKDGLLSDRVMQAIPLDPDGKRVAIATAQGFTLKDGADLKSLYAFHGLVNNHVYSMAPDGENLYLGTLGGISAVSNMRVTGSWTQMDSQLRQNWVNALLPLDGRLWIGMYGAGLQFRTKSGEWDTIDSLPERFEVNANALYADDRYLFCGTLDRGFFFMDRKDSRWRQFLQPLPGNNVTAFAGGSPFLYVATDRGLLRIKYDKLSTIPSLR